MAEDDSDAGKALQEFSIQQARELAALRADQIKLSAKQATEQQEQRLALTISESEFAHWLRPSQCFELLSPQWSYQVIRSTILRHLIHEQMWARAGTLIITGNAPKQTHRFALVPSEAWEIDQPSYDSHFWENGLFDFSTGYGYDEREFSCFDVRFDPAVIRSLIRSEKPASAEPKAETPKAVGGGARARHTGRMP